MIYGRIARERVDYTPRHMLQRCKRPARGMIPRTGRKYDSAHRCIAIGPDASRVPCSAIDVDELNGLLVWYVIGTRVCRFRKRTANYHVRWSLSQRRESAGGEASPSGPSPHRAYSRVTARQTRSDHTDPTATASAAPPRYHSIRVIASLVSAHTTATSARPPRPRGHANRQKPPGPQSACECIRT